MPNYGPHEFHIPVMGTGFTIDTPLKVAKYGISSVISIVDDVLVEQMRKYYSEMYQRPYEMIDEAQEDFRALRIEKYLNLMHDLVKAEFGKLRDSLFSDKTELTRYFRLLPESPLKEKYRRMLAQTNESEKNQLQMQLRAEMQVGTIDVNIMTKLDRDIYKGKEILPHKFADAMSALRGYAKSNLDSCIVFSAGLNQRLYSYISEFPDFFPNEFGKIKKRVVLKVSDYRSALIQGRFMAKKGILVSEYRIESGLNCGGHAFATQGVLQGPILEEFRQKRDELFATVWSICQGALQDLGKPLPAQMPPVKITMQGGIGTAQEQKFLLDYYKLDRTGWGTPFLFVREVTNMDDESMEIIKAATEKESYLSESSPLGIPFWNIRNTMSENDRRRKIEEGKPGSPCPRGYLVSNTEFSVKPICTASKGFQGQKLKVLANNPEHLNRQQLEIVKDLVLSKSCLCYDLTGGAVRRLKIEPGIPTAVCAGPNVINYNREFTLEEMLDHIYDRGVNLVSEPDRPHMLIREAELYLQYFEREKLKNFIGYKKLKPEYFVEFIANLKTGLAYYEMLAPQLPQEQQEQFKQGLKKLRRSVESLHIDTELEHLPTI